jgi:HEAT repeat protein
MPVGLHYWKILAVKELVRAVESNSGSATEEALRKVKERRTTKLAVPRLIDVLEQTAKKRSLPRTLITATRGIGSPAISALSEVAKTHENYNVRTYAIIILGSMESAAKEAVPTLIQLLNDEIKYVRLAAAQAIGKIDETKSEVALPVLPVLPVLLVLLQDEDRDVRIGAVFGIGDFGKHAENALPKLLEALNDPDQVVRALVCPVIGNVGIASENAINALIKVLFDEKAENYRYRAANSLGEFGPRASSAVPALLETMKKLDEKEDFLGKSYVIEALGKIGVASPDVIDALVQSLNDERSEFCRKYAAKALGILGTQAKSSIPALIEALKDEDEDVKGAAAQALIQIDPETASNTE